VHIGYSKKKEIFFGSTKRLAKTSLSDRIVILTLFKEAVGTGTHESKAYRFLANR